MNTKISPELKKQLKRMIRRVRMIMLVRGLVAVAGVLIAVILAIMAIDATVVFYSQRVRWAFSLSGFALVAAAVYNFLVRPLIRPLSLTRMARVLETRHPDIQERISSAIELAKDADDHVSKELIDLLERDAEVDVRGVTPKREFTARSVKPFLVTSICLALVFSLLLMIWPQQTWLLFLRTLFPNKEFDTLLASQLVIEPGDFTMLENEELRMLVEAPPRHGVRAEVIFVKDEGLDVIERMKKVSLDGADKSVFELWLPTVGESFEYRIRYGLGLTKPYFVKVVKEPAITQIKISYSYPAYTGLISTQIVSSAVEPVRAVEGTRLTVEADFDRICLPTLRLPDLPLPAAAQTNALWLQRMSTNRTGRWSIALRDSWGFTNLPVEAPWVALPDRKPRILLKLPETKTLQIPVHDRVEFYGSARDDFGLSALEMVIRSSSKKKDFILPLTVERGGRNWAELKGAPNLMELDNLGFHSFKLFFRASDNRPPEYGGPQVHESRVINISIKDNAKPLREQQREKTKREVHKLLEQAKSNLDGATSEIAQEKNNFAKEVIPESAQQKLEEARRKAIEAEELLYKAVEKTEKTPFVEFAEKILDVRDDFVEKAFKEIDEITQAEPKERHNEAQEAENSLRKAASEVNKLMYEELQKQDREQQKQSKLEDLARKEQELAADAQEQMDKQDMQKWEQEQSRAEQNMWQTKDAMKEKEFKKSLKELQEARADMRKAQQEMTPEESKTAEQEQKIAKRGEEAVNKAEEAAESALEAAEEAKKFAEMQKVAEAIEKASEKTKEAAVKAEEAAEQAQRAAEQRKANETLEAAVEKQEAAQKVLDAAKEAHSAAEEVEQAAKESAEAANAQEQNKPEEAKQAAEKAAESTEQAQEQAKEANIDAVEASREAEEENLEKSAEAAQVASESSAFTQRAAELAEDAAAKAEQAENMEEKEKQQAVDEAQGLAEQSKQVAKEAAEKAQEAVEKAQDQLDQLKKSTEQAKALQAESDQIREQAAQAQKAARQASDQAQEAVESAQEAVAAAEENDPLNQALAERMQEASQLAEQAAELAESSAEQTQQAEAEEMPASQEQAATQQAIESAQTADKLAEAAQQMADLGSQQMEDAVEQAQQSARQAARQASKMAKDARQSAKRAEQLMKNMELPAQSKAADLAQHSAQLSQDASQLAQESLQSARKEASRDQAMPQAQQSEQRAQQALELAQQARESAESQQPDLNHSQQQAARKVENLADMMMQAVEDQQQREAQAWMRAQGRIGGRLNRAAVGGGGGSSRPDMRRELNPDWVRFKGKIDSESYEQMLKKTPPEYRDLVKQYFEELSKE